MGKWTPSQVPGTQGRQVWCFVRGTKKGRREVRVQAGTGKGGGFENHLGTETARGKVHVEAGKFGLWWGMARGLGHRTGKEVTVP